MYDVGPEQYATVIRELIRHENDVTNHRIMWLLIVQGLLTALVVAKVVLLADMLPFVNRFPDKPLIYNVLWKTLLYVFAALVVHYLEHLGPIWWRTRDLLGANRRLLDEIVWAHFWAIQLWLLVLLFVYCAFRELVRVIGAREVKRMFFETPSRSSPPQSAQNT